MPPIPQNVKAKIAGAVAVAWSRGPYESRPNDYVRYHYQLPHKDAKGVMVNRTSGLFSDNIIELYGLKDKYNTPLKQKVFKESEEYKTYKKNRDIERSNVFKTDYYLAYRVEPTKYDLDRQGFVFETNYYINHYNLRFQNKFRSDKIIFNITDEKKALEMEKVMENLCILLIFNVNNVFSSTNYLIPCIEKKILIYNCISGKIYIEKDCEKMEVEETPKEKKEDKESEEKIYDIVEEMPKFPGGLSAISSFLSQNIKYPLAAAENGIEGRVIVGFVVETDGSISNVKVVRGVDPELDKEAIRVVSHMPKWIPGKQNGKSVRVNYSTSVTFRLQ